MRYVLSIAGAENWMRTIESLLWMTVAYVGLTLVRNLGQLGDLEPTLWVNKVPGLFFALARAVLIFFVFTRVLSGIWGVDLSTVTTWVGVGSAAIALALQDTLSNLVSGFLLLADRPFQVGEWIRVGDQWLFVKQIGWRTTRFESYDEGATVIIPNGSLGKSEIVHYGQEGDLYTMYAFLRFSHDDPPNRVRQVVFDVLEGIDVVRDDPPPEVTTLLFEEHAVRYRLRFCIDLWDGPVARNAVFSQIYYAAKRNGLTLARPIEFRGTLDDLKPKPVTQEIAGMLRTNALFEPLPAESIDWLVTDTTLITYGRGETIVHQGEPDRGFYVIETGEVTVSARDGVGQSFDMDYLKAGAFFGEMALLTNEPSPISVTATTDVQLLVLEGSMITHLIETSPLFAQELNFFIEKRQAAMDALNDTEDGEQPQNQRHDWINIVKQT